MQQHQGGCPKFRRDPNDNDDQEEMIYLWQSDVHRQIALGDALTTAVKKFETKELEGLVKNQYEVVVAPNIEEEDFVLIYLSYDNRGLGKT